MTKRSITHGSFTLERTYDATPSRVFAAFSNPEAKAVWFHGPPGWVSKKHQMEFRPGGREVAIGGPPGGTQSRFDCLYYDIVQNERIVYTYEMHLDDRKISVSLATIELAPAGTGTRLTITEHGAFLDGYDGADGREQGTKALLEQIAAALK